MGNKKISDTVGLPPGTPVYIGKKGQEKVGITLIDYDEKQIQEKQVTTIEECFPFKEKPTVSWINIDGIHKIDIIEKLGAYFAIHPLTIEDIVNTKQRPKMEEYENYVFIVLKMLSYNSEKVRVADEQVSLILGENFVISFQEREGDVFENIRERIRNYKGRIRKMSADYLAYALIDSIVDNYFVILEEFGKEIEVLEEQLVNKPTTHLLHNINKYKKELILLRKAVWPLREVISRLTRDELQLIKENTVIYLRDVYDHTIQIIDSIENFRDVLSSVLDIYLSSISNRMNEIMKTLTIIATIFIPLTFIVGIYGMNFEYIPELKWRWGYFAVLIFMTIISGIMIIYFRRKKWL